jgi:hypothetical protein
MTRRDLFLLTGAVAATMQAASVKTSNANAALALGLVGTFCAFIANAPPFLSTRDPEARERAIDPKPDA